MKPRILVLALIAALGSGCASNDKMRLAYEVKPVSTVRHGGANAVSYYQLGRYYHGQMRLDMAETAYRKSLSLDDQRVESLNALGSLFAERGDLTRAVEQFRQALALAPASGYLYNNLGYAYYLQGRLAEAADAVRNALIFEPTLERGWVNLERIAAAQSDMTLLAEAKSRRIDALRGTVLAQAAPVETAAQPAVETAVEQVSESPRLAAASESLVSASTVANGVATVVQPAVVDPAVVDPLPASPRAQIVVSSATENRELQTAASMADPLEGGKFVLVSTRREIVDLAAPALITPSEPLVPARQPEPSPAYAMAPPSASIHLPIPTSIPVANPGTDFDMSRVKVEVSNANGVGGFARKYGVQLREHNIPVRRITNHSSFQFKETVIEYQPGFEDAARALMVHTQLDVQLALAKAPRVNSDVRILLGRDALQLARTTLASAR